MDSSAIETKDITDNDVVELINYDQIHLQQAMKEDGLANDELAPPLTRGELLNALQKADILKWIFFEHKLAGYFWLEKKADCLYINAIAIDRRFQGKGIVQYILAFADTISEECLLDCRLSVSPKNGKALNVYLKSGYKVVNAVSSLFGQEFPGTFRVIMEKSVSNGKHMVKINEKIDIYCSDYEAIRNITNSGFIGTKLIVSSNKDNERNMIHFVKFNNEKC